MTAARHADGPNAVPSCTRVLRRYHQPLGVMCDVLMPSRPTGSDGTCMHNATSCRLSRGGDAGGVERRERRPAALSQPIHPAHHSQRPFTIAAAPFALLEPMPHTLRERCGHWLRGVRAHLAGGRCACTCTAVDDAVDQVGVGGRWSAALELLVDALGLGIGFGWPVCAEVCVESNEE